MNCETAPDSEKKVVLYLELTIRERHVSSRERRLEESASSAAAAKGKSEGKEKINIGDCTQWTTKGQCTQKKREAEGKGKGPQPSNSPRRNSLERGTPTGKFVSVKENQPTCFAFEKSDCQKGNCKLGSKCAFTHTEKAWSEPIILQ